MYRILLLFIVWLNYSYGLVVFNQYGITYANNNYSVEDFPLVIHFKMNFRLRGESSTAIHIEDCMGVLDSEDGKYRLTTASTCLDPILFRERSNSLSEYFELRLYDVNRILHQGLPIIRFARDSNLFINRATYIAQATGLDIYSNSQVLRPKKILVFSEFEKYLVPDLLGEAVVDKYIEPGMLYIYGAIDNHSIRLVRYYASWSLYNYRTNVEDRRMLLVEQKMVYHGPRQRVDAYPVLIFNRRVDLGAPFFINKDNKYYLLGILIGLDYPSMGGEIVYHAQPVLGMMNRFYRDCRSFAVTARCLIF